MGGQKSPGGGQRGEKQWGIGEGTGENVRLKGGVECCILLGEEGKGVGEVEG